MAEYKVNYTQSNFTGGIIATELYGRNDFNKVKTGLKTCTNWTIREAGGLEFRRGTKYISTLPAVNAGDFRMATINDRLLFFCSDGIKYLDSDNVWQTLQYPLGTPPVLSKLQFTELRQRLYYYDGSNKLRAVYLDEDGDPTTQIETFETVPSGVGAALTVSGTAPTVYVPVSYTYAVSLAKDDTHEGLPVKSGTVTANAELTAQNSDTDQKGQQIDIAITIPSDLSTEYAGGKIYIYKKYQGNFYYLTSVDVVSGTTSYSYSDKGEFSVDTSKSFKVAPSYLNADGSIQYVNSVADYGQRLFLTRSTADTNVIYTQVGYQDSLAYSSLRNSDEAGYLEVPIDHYDSWCKVVSGLDLVFSTNYTMSKISGYGDLQLDTIIWDGLSQTVQPIRTRRSLVYTNSSNRNIYDLTYNEYGQYDSVDLTLLVKYIFENKTIKRLAFKDYPVKTIYVLCTDGDLYCLTYIKEQNIYAWYKIEHQDFIYDICVVNLETEDDVYIVTRQSNGTTYYLEKAYRRTDTVYMDCVVVKPLTGITNNKVTGLSIFEGKTVRVYDTGNNRFYGEYDILNPQSITEGGRTKEVDTLEFLGYTVTNGEIQLPTDIDLAGDLLVGLPYYGVAETIPLEFQDTNGNSTIGRKKAINEAYLRYGDSRGLTYKTMGHEYDCGICGRDISENAQFLERGQVKLHTNSEYKWDSTIKILQRQPYPARIESITLGLTFNDKS